MRILIQRMVFALLRLEAVATAMAGLALLAAGVASLAAGVDNATIRTVGLASAALALGLTIIGGLTLYLGRVAAGWPPDDRTGRAAAADSPAGWLLLLPLTLGVAPLVLLVQLQPLAQFWREVAALANQLDPWRSLGESSGMAGVLFLPVFAALAVPGVQTLAAGGYMLHALLVLGLLLVGSTRVPRALLLSVLVQGALVVASVGGTIVVDRVAPALERLIRETPDVGGNESARALEELQRYRLVTRATGGTLVWTWAVMTLWLPVLTLNPRAREVFAATGTCSNDRASSGTGPDARHEGELDPETVDSMDERDRARAYDAAAREVERSTPRSRWF